MSPPSYKRGLNQYSQTRYQVVEKMSIPMNENESDSEAMYEAINQETKSVDLAGIVNKLPVKSESLLISKLLEIFGELAIYPNDKANWDKMEHFIDERLDKVTELIEEYNRMAIPPDVEEIHYKVLDAFVLYYEGLFEFKDLLFDMDEKNIKRGFDLIMNADNMFMDIEDDLQRQVDEMVISTIL